MSPSSGVDREGNFSDMSQHAQTTCLISYYLVKDEIEGKKMSLLAQMYDRNRILVMLPIMWLNIS